MKRSETPAAEAYIFFKSEKGKFLTKSTALHTPKRAPTPIISARFGVSSLRLEINTRNNLITTVTLYIFDLYNRLSPTSKTRALFSVNNRQYTLITHASKQIYAPRTISIFELINDASTIGYKPSSMQFTKKYALNNEHT